MPQRNPRQLRSLRYAIALCLSSQPALTLALECLATARHCSTWCDVLYAENHCIVCECRLCSYCDADLGIPRQPSPPPAPKPPPPNPPPPKPPPPRPPPPKPPPPIKWPPPPPPSPAPPPPAPVCKLDPDDDGCADWCAPHNCRLCRCSRCPSCVENGWSTMVLQLPETKTSASPVAVPARNSLSPPPPPPSPRPHPPPSPSPPPAICKPATKAQPAVYAGCKEWCSVNNCGKCDCSGCDICRGYVKLFPSHPPPPAAKPIFTTNTHAVLQQMLDTKLLPPPPPSPSPPPRSTTVYRLPATIAKRPPPPRPPPPRPSTVSTVHEPATTRVDSLDFTATEQFPPSPAALTPTLDEGPAIYGALNIAREEQEVALPPQRHGSTVLVGGSLALVASVGAGLIFAMRHRQTARRKRGGGNAKFSKLKIGDYDDDDDDAGGRKGRGLQAMPSDDEWDDDDDDDDDKSSATNSQTLSNVALSVAEGSVLSGGGSASGSALLVNDDDDQSVFSAVDRARRNQSQSGDPGVLHVLAANSNLATEPAVNDAAPQNVEAPALKLAAASNARALRSLD